MKTRTLILAAVIPCLLTFPAAVLAQGTAITYQGRLQSGANPTTGTYDITFALYNASSGGTQVGSTLTNAGLQITNGLFTVILDFGSVYNGTSYWLQIGVRTNGAGVYTALSPRQEVTPTPYAITAENLDGTIPANQITGTLPGGGLSGAYTNAVTLGNPGNSFAGNGAGLLNVNAATLNGLYPSNFWQLGGNTVASNQFLGSVNNQAVNILVNNSRGLRIEPDPTFSVPNVIGGSFANYVIPGSVGNVIAGGGYSGAGTSNYISGQNLNVISGGYANRVTTGFENVIGGGQNNTAASPDASVIGGGNQNTVNGSFATIPGGSSNLATGDYSFAAGQNAQAINTGTFVWADDSSTTPFASANPNQFLVRAQFIGLNRTNYVTGADVFDVGSPATNYYGGMYVDTAGTNGWPFYGYSQGGFANAWTYLDGSDTNKWKLNVAFEDRLTVTTTGRVGINTTSPGAQLHVQEGPAPTGISDPFGPNQGPGIWIDTTDTDGIFASTTGAGAFAVYAIAGGGAANAVTAFNGNTNPAAGANGIQASTSCTNGAGVLAIGANSSSPALAIGIGSLRVINAGIDTSTTAFIHVATAGNIIANSTVISNSVCDGDPDALLLVTPTISPQGVAAPYNYHPIGTFYNGAHWAIFNADTNPFTVGSAFAVLIVKH